MLVHAKIIANSLDGKDWIKNSAAKKLHYADICSAHIQSEAFRYLFEDIFNSAPRIRVLARWAPGDLLSKSRYKHFVETIKLLFNFGSKSKINKLNEKPTIVSGFHKLSCHCYYSCHCIRQEAS